MMPVGILIHRCETGHTGPEVKKAEAQYGLGYHYFIRKDGTVDRLYEDSALVWHALHHSTYMLSIAVYGDFHPADKSRNSKPTTAQLISLVKLCTSLWEKYGALPIYGHTDLPNASTDPSKVCPGRNLDVASIAKQVFLSFDWTKVPRANDGAPAT